MNAPTQRLSRLTLLGLLYLALPLPTPALPATPEPLEAIQNNPKALQQAMDAGRQIASFCSNCHGDNGLSRIPEVPNLASQNPAYILDQMRKFERGERGDKFMQGLIKALKADERVQVALFFSHTPLPQRTTPRPANANDGKALYDARCAGCHGPNARGNNEIPRLAGQQTSYLTLSIDRYRSRTGERRNEPMSVATANLGKQEIAALAGYLSSMP